MVQSYQQVEKILIKDLYELYFQGVHNLNKIKLGKFDGDFQDYIFCKQKSDSLIYERLVFDTNSAKPSCNTLGRIIGGFMLSGFIDYDRNIRIENVKKYLNTKQ